MKTIKKHLKKFSIIMGLSLLFVSCSQYEEANTPNQNTNSSLLQRNGKTYTGVEMFKGIYFLQNDIADNISQLKSIKEMLINEQSNSIGSSLKELSEISVEFINTNYPNFFNDFKAKLESGNLYEIDIIIDYGAKLIEQSALSSEKYKGAFLFNEKIKSDAQLRSQIENLDLSTQQGLDELNEIIIDNTDGGNMNNLVPSLAFFYVGAVAISIAAVLYSVYYKVAYWGPRAERGRSLNVNGNVVNIERETYIAEVGSYFSSN